MVEAISGPQKNTSADMKFARPVVTVRALLVLVNTCAYRNSFQACVNERTSPPPGLAAPAQDYT